MLHSILRAIICSAAGLLLILSESASAQKLVALVIGNGAYRNAAPLLNPKNDAEDVAESLRRVGFETIVETNLDKSGMEEAVIRFAKEARKADIALFYYSGHAMQFSGVNYLMPVDAKLTDEADLRRMSRLDDIVTDIQKANALRILVLDSCRDNPLADELKRSINRTRAAGMQRGLAKVDAAQGMIVAYATQAGHTADDGYGRNSPYTSAFLRHIEAPEEIGTIFRRISADVYKATNQSQLPELSLSLIGEIYLRGRRNSDGPIEVVRPKSDAEQTWAIVQNTKSIAILEDFITQYGETAFGRLARVRVEELKAASIQNQKRIDPTVREPHLFDGTWEFKLSGGTHCLLKSLTFRLRIESNSVLSPLGTKLGTVDENGNLRFSTPSPANPRMTARFQGKIKGKAGGGTYFGEKTPCRGTHQIQLVEN